MNLNWIQEEETNEYQGPPKEGFTLTFIPELNKLILIGGTFNHDNAIHLYDLSRRQWSIQKISGIKMDRKYHSACYVSSIKGILLYGGEADSKRILDSFDLIHVDDWRRRKLIFKTPIVPKARKLHSFTPIANGDFLIFGGMSSPNENYLNDLWVLKGVDKLKETKTIEISGCTINQINGKGQVPIGRSSHQAFCSGGNYYVLGGVTEVFEPEITLFMMNLQKNFWSRCSLNLKLRQIYEHSMFRNPENPEQFLILGGYFIVNNNEELLNNHLISLSCEGTQPELKKLEKVPETSLSYFCEMPFQDTIGMQCEFTSHGYPVLHRVEIEKESDLSIEEYLKYIKNEQLLSQELMNKVENLEELYKEFQNYTCLLYKNYQDEGQTIERIERVRKQQIEKCFEFKEKYIEIDKVYHQNVDDLKKARRDIARINQLFEGYIETERDEDQ